MQTNATDRPAAGGGASVDDVLDALADEERRRALSFLEEADGPVPFEDIVAHAGTEPSEGRLRPNEDDPVAIRLDHVHLPKLADAGLITYDRRGGVAEATNARELDDR